MFHYLYIGFTLSLSSSSSGLSDFVEKKNVESLCRVSLSLALLLLCSRDNDREEEEEEEEE